MFVADDLGAWLVGALADAGRRRLTVWLLGTDQERALRQAASTAVQLTAQELRPNRGEQAEQLAMVVSQVFGEPIPGAPLSGQGTLLEELQAGIAIQLAPLDDPGLTGTGKSSAGMLEIPEGVLAEKLTSHLVREIVLRGARGGPLAPLATQLNHDVTHLQGQRLEGMVGQLAEELREALVRHSEAIQAGEIGRSIHFQDAFAPMLAPRQLPADTPHFTGRVRDLEALDDAIPQTGKDAPAAMMITAIQGMGGVGKTALAVHWAHLVADRFADGILYTNLRGYDPVHPPAEPGEVVDELLRDLGVPDTQIRGNLDARTKLYRSRLQGRNVLVILDNAATPEQVRPLLPASPSCGVVVTSRSSLQGLVARDGVRRLTLGVLSTEQSVQLLRRVLGTARVDGQFADALELCRLCAYLPLALCIAAERATARPHVTLTDLADELSDERERLDLLSADDDPVTAVRAVFSWSYKALPPELARMFRLLGLHTGTDIGEAAAAVLADHTLAKTRRFLEALARVYLLQEREGNRYQFHDLLRVYAAECAEHDESAEDRRAAIRRLFDWYLQTASAADRFLIPQRRAVPLDPPGTGIIPLSFATRDEALAWWDTERKNLMAVTRHAADIGEDTVAWKLPLVLWSIFTLKKPWTDWISSHGVALASARRVGDGGGEAWVLNNLGVAYRQTGDYNRALEHYEEALQIWHRLGDRWGEAQALNNLGETYQELKRHREALEPYLAALPIWREIGDKWGEGSTLTGLGTVHHSLGRYDKALEFSNQALVAFLEIGDRRGEGRSFSQIGEAYFELGRFEEAINSCRNALDARLATGDQWGVARTLYSLGQAQLGARLLDEARHSWTEALEIFDVLRAPFATEVRKSLDELSDMSQAQPSHRAPRSGLPNGPDVIAEPERAPCTAPDAGD